MTTIDDIPSKENQGREKNITVKKRVPCLVLYPDSPSISQHPLLLLTAMGWDKVASVSTSQQPNLDRHPRRGDAIPAWKTVYTTTEILLLKWIYGAESS